MGTGNWMTTIGNDEFDYDYDFDEDAFTDIVKVEDATDLLEEIESDPHVGDAWGDARASTTWRSTRGRSSGRQTSGRERRPSSRCCGAVSRKHVALVVPLTDAVQLAQKATMELLVRRVSRSVVVSPPHTPAPSLFSIAQARQASTMSHPAHTALARSVVAMPALSSPAKNMSPGRPRHAAFANRELRVN